MELDLGEFLTSNPAVLLFLVIGFGYMLGRLQIRGTELGTSGGVLFAALLFGHFGYQLPRIIETLGFVFFIYSVGFQCGPRFLTTFREGGIRFAILSVAVAAVAVAVALGCSMLFGLDRGFAAGILGGALTSTPTLAAAQDAVSSGVVTLREGESPDEIISNITVGYAITYAFGLIGLLMLIRLVPRWFGVDLRAEAEELSQRMKISEEGDGDVFDLGKRGFPLVRVYRISNEDVCNVPLRELRFVKTTNCMILRYKRNDIVTTPDDQTVLKPGDLVAVMGFPDNLEKARELLGGRLIEDEDLGHFRLGTRRVVVTNSEMIGTSLQETDLIRRFQCLVDRLTRSRLELPVSPDLTLERGDILWLIGLESQLDQAAKMLGHAERPVHETDLLTFSLGIVIGIIIGSTVIRVGQVPFGIGMAGGLLIAGLFVGHMRTRNPTIGQVPAAARFVLMELGILFFLAGVGLRAGQNLFAGLQAVGLPIFLTGVLVTSLPLMVGYAIGRWLLKMNPVILLGALAGSITSTPALDIVNKDAKSTLPTLGYVGSYAIANIILTLIGQLVMYIGN